MIKKSIFVLFVCIMMASSFVMAETIFSDGFESGAGQWTESVEYDWNIETPAERQIPGFPSGNKVMHADNCDNNCYLTSDEIDLSGYEDVTVKFHRYVDRAIDWGEYLKVEAYDGSNWNQIFYWTQYSGDDDTWHYETWSVPSGYLVEDFKIRFVSKESQKREETEFDNMLIEGTFVDEELDSCSDTDGGNYPFTFGITSGYYNNNPFSHNDYCVDSSNVMEYFCSGDYEQNSQVSCGTDTYGDNYCSNGSVFHDYYDYFCSSGECDYSVNPVWIEECEYGCDGGECMGIPDSCSGTEGPYSNFVVEVFGTVSGYFDEQYYSYDDYCVNGTVLKEYACTGAGYVYSASYDMDCVAMNFTACVNGACI